MPVAHRPPDYLEGRDVSSRILRRQAREKTNQKNFDRQTIYGNAGGNATAGGFSSSCRFDTL